MNKLGLGHSRRQIIQYVGDSNAKPANARLAASLSGFDRDSLAVVHDWHSTVDRRVRSKAERSGMPSNGSTLSGDPRSRSFVEGTPTAARPHGGRTTSARIVRCIHLLCGERLEKAGKLVRSQAGFTNERPQGPLREDLVVRNDKSAKRGSSVPKDHMAAPLTIDFVTDTREGADRIRTRNNRELAHTATSTISSSIEGGIASSWASRLSR